MRLDHEVADSIARRTNATAEGCGKVLTFFASEKVVYAAAAAIWAITRHAGDVRRRQGNHLIMAIVVSALLQRGLKQVVIGKITGSAAAALSTSLGCTAVLFALWHVWPWISRKRTA